MKRKILKIYNLILKLNIILIMCIFILELNTYAHILNDKYETVQYYLDKERIYEIKNPDCNCLNHSNYDYFLGSGDSLFVSDEKEHKHYYGLRDIETGEIKIIREIKYRKAKEEEWEDSDSGYRFVSVKYYDKNKKLVYTFLDDTYDCDMYINYGNKNDIIYKNCLIINLHRNCIDISSGREDKIMLNKFNDYKSKINNDKIISNDNLKRNTKNQNSVINSNNKDNIKERVSFRYNDNTLDGYKIYENYIAFADEKTFVLNKNSELLKEILDSYKDVNIVTDDSGEIIMYEFIHKDDRAYNDIYDRNFNIVFEKIEDYFYIDEYEYIGINKNDSGVYKEENYFDGLYTSLYDKNFKLIKKFDKVKSIRASWYGGEECFLVDDYGYGTWYGYGAKREIYDLNFKMIKDDIYDMLYLKNKKSNEEYLLITDSNSTKIYNKNNKLIKDLKCKMLNSHLADYTEEDYILNARESSEWRLSAYYNVGIFPIIFLNEMVFIRTDGGAKIFNDKFDVVADGYKEFIDFNDEYFTFFKDKSYGLMNYNLNVLVEFKRNN